MSLDRSGERLAAGSENGVVQVWDLDRRQSRPSVFAGLDRSLDALAFHADGRRLFVGGRRGAIQLWSLGDPPRRQASLPGHIGFVSALALGVDDSTLISGGDVSIRLWDLDDERAEPVVLSGHEMALSALALSADGRLLASGDYAGVVRLWRLSPAELRAAACRRAGRNLSLREWREYRGEAAYRRTCPQLPLAPELIARLVERAAVRPSADLIERLRAYLDPDDADPVAARAEARRLLAKGLLRQSLDHAFKRDIPAALESLSLARRYQPDLPEPDNVYGPKIWNRFCWQGALLKRADEVLWVCEQAVTRRPWDGYIRDSRGLARALSGDLPGAAADFQAFVRSARRSGSVAPQMIDSRRRWVEALLSARNPFDAETLRRLREE